MVTRSVPPKTRLPVYSHIEQLPDPPRRPEMNEYPRISAFTQAMSLWFRDRDDVVVGSAGYLWRTPTDRHGPYPDGVLAKGVKAPGEIIYRNGYVISEVGKPPDLVLEVGSHSTGRRDYTVKREIYAEYGVGEYWRFDPSGGENHDVPLAGDRLVDGQYEPIEIVVEPDGRHWGYSDVVGLEFWWESGKFRFRDPVSGEFLPTLEEAQDAAVAAEAQVVAAEAQAVAAEARAGSERLAREVAEARAESERAARELAERRAAEMEAELRRLRGEEDSG